MAEVLYNVAAGLILSLSSSAVKEIGLLWGVTDELHKLRRTVATIQAVLLHAEEQFMENPQVKHWLAMLSEALYDADDVLDEFSTEALRQQVMAGSNVAKKVALFFSCLNQFDFGLKMGHKVKALRQRLDEIAAEKNKFHLEERSGIGRSFVPKGRYQTHSSPPQVVIGREHEKDEIVRLLLSSDCDENVSVVSIVGIGGLGKTTLAQMVYDDANVKSHFELKMWVCVSDDFDVHLLVKKSLESATRENVNIAEMDPLKNILHEKINGRKYLLVLDDVWNEDVNKWSRFRDLLAGGARGSKIIITTRLKIVAEMSRPFSIFELRGLSKNESWSLFEQVAFKQGQLPNPSLEVVGKEIVEKCCGVPLAIKTIGGVLYFKDPYSDWVLFKDNELSKIDVFKHDILPILRLSYNHLPFHYKHCLAYCSLYPKDFNIPVDELILLWKAQGYIKPTNLNECLRDAGFEYFMDLFRLSFFQDVETDYFGNITHCKMHNLMHDLAVSVAGDNFAASHSGMTTIKNNTQHISFQGYSNNLSWYVSSLLKAKKIRTILTLDGGYDTKTEEVDVVFCSLRCLRVLNLSGMGINLPNSIYKLQHLRYLDLSRNHSIRKLPNSITDLQNLEVLKLEGCYNLMQLPSNITKLVNLTDLDNNYCSGLSHMPRDIGKLTQLEKLSEFVIAKDHSISKHTGGLNELHSLNNLRGELEIKNVRYVKNGVTEFTGAHLSLKQKLQKLALDWGKYEDENNNCSANDVANDEMAMEALCPHPNLKALKVWCWRGVKPPSWLPSLINLASIGFWNCRNIQWLPPFDHLPYLKRLQISGLTKLERIDVENGGESSLFFPSLIGLTLVGCSKLKGFERLSSLSTEELPCFPCLSLLRVIDCPNLTYLPHFPELKTLNLHGDEIESLMKMLKMPTNSASEPTYSPFSTLSQLQSLEISYMEDSLDDKLLQYLPSLQSLSFMNCSFRTVCGDGKDDKMQWQSLNVLRSIEFRYMANLVSLPKGLQYVTTLQRLYIDECPSLVCIPEWIPKLTALQDLSIRSCPQVEERCENNSAEDWPYISHVPNIFINNKQTQRNGCYQI